MGVRDNIKSKMKELKKINIMGEEMYIKLMSGAERTKYLSMMPDKATTVDVIKAQDYLVAVSTTDETGKRLYDDNEIEAVGQELPAFVIDELSKEIADYNGFGSEELKKEIKN
jgi:hypothetical protein